MAAALPSTTWAKIEPTLWSMAFAGKARTTRCKCYFSLSHSKQHCELSPAPSQTSDTQTKSSSTIPASQSFQARQCLICNEWNYNPAPCRPIPRCCYRHICLPCSRNPRIIDKSHKAIFCPNLPGQTPCTQLSLVCNHYPSHSRLSRVQDSHRATAINLRSGFQRFQSY